MRGILTAVALVLTLVLTSAASAVTVGNNGTYQIGDSTLRIEPFSTEGIRFVDADGRTRLWKVKTCFEFVYMRSCLTSATATEATFTDEFIGAVLRTRSELTPTSMSLGDIATGAVTLTNANELPAKNVLVTLRLTGPGTFVDGSPLKEMKGQVNSEWIIPFRIAGTGPGVVKLTGSVTYFDQNTTRTLQLDNRSLTVTVPFTIETLYDNTTTSNVTEVRVTLTRKTSEELESSLVLRLPQQATVFAVDRGVNQDGNKLTRRATLVNTSKYNLSATYSFRSEPTTPMLLDVSYTIANASRESYTIAYPFIGTEDSEPSLGVRIDPTPAGEPGVMRVIITGNTTGALDVSGDYFNDARIVGAGTYDIIAKAAPVGNYTHTLNFSWVTAYGTPRSIGGRAVLMVTPAVVRAEPNRSTTTPPVLEQPPTIVLVTDVPKESALPILWIVAGLALGCIGGLAYILHHVRTPVHRVERLLVKLSALHRIQAEQKGTLSPEKEKQIKELEEQLRELQERL